MTLYTETFRDHPVDEDAPHVVPTSFLRALNHALSYSPTFDPPTCSGARCECGEPVDDDRWFAVADGYRFICETCEEADHA